MTSSHQEWLLVSHATSPTITILNTDSLDVVATLPMRGRIAVLDKSQSGHYAFVNHRDDHLVSIIRISDPPTIAHVVSTGQEPTHFHAHGDQIVIFNDGDGSVSIFDEAQLELDATPETIKVTQPDHGSAVVLGDFVLAGFLRLGRVDVYRRGTPDCLMTFERGKGLHGAAQVGDIALFGCTDGVLLVKREGDTLRSVKLDNPAGTPMRVRVGLFATHPQQSIALGNFGHGLAIIDPHAETIEVLPLSGAPMKFAFESTSANILVLTSDGKFQQLDTATRQVTHAIDVMPSVPEPKGPGGSPRPSFAIGATGVFITSPEEQCLIEVSLTSLTMRRRINLPETPSGVVCLHG